MAGTTATSSLSHIEKLRGIEDYHNWKFSIRNLLILEDLWDCVAKPPTKTSDSEKSSDSKNDQKALAKICLSVQSSAFPFVRNAKTAHEAWNNLKTAFEDQGLCRRLNLLRSLFNTRLCDCESMEEYISKMTNVAQQLSDIGSPLDDDFLGVIMLSGLTSDFDPLIMALENSNIKLASETVKAKLLQEDQRREVKQESLLASALAVRKTVKCFNCGKLGHVIRDCPSKKPATHPSSGSKDKGKWKDKALLTALSVSVSDNMWYVDSGATNHMCNDKSVMCDFTSNIPVDVRVANGEKLATAGIGVVKVQLKDCLRTVKDVYYVPKLTTNLLSVSAMAKKGYKIVFTKDNCKIYDDDDEVIASATHINGVYQLDIVNDEQARLASTVAMGQRQCLGSNNSLTDSQMTNDDETDRLLEEEVPESTSLASSRCKVLQEVWHQRLGHLNSRSMHLLNKGMATGITYDSTDYKSCIACIEGKQSRLPLPSKSLSRANEILGVVHSDLCGPIQTSSFSGARYFLLFIDDLTRKTFVYFLKAKSETFEHFKEFKALVENQTNRKIKILRSDGGGEYINSQFQTYLKANGIRHQTTVPHTPAQNGVAERANRTVMEAARCMMQQAGLDKKYWAEAVNTAVYLKNRSPTKAVRGVTPEEAWTNQKVDLSHLRIFGCLAHTLVKTRKKLDSKSKPCVFVGYCTETKGYRLLDISNPQKCIIARDVVFLENKFKTKDMSHDDNVIMNNMFMQTPPKNNNNLRDLSDSNERTSEPSIEGSNQSDDINSESDNDINDSQNPRKESIISIADSEESSASGDIDDSSDSTYIPGRSSLEADTDYEECAEFAGLCNMLSSTNDEPTTVNEAMSGSEAEHWRTAMSDEYKSFLKNQCWTLVDRPKDQKAVKCKWVFKRKRGLDGEILRYKARLVAKGYTQKYGVDYEETFSPVVRYATIRILLAIAAEYEMEIDHMDVTTAFLNGDLQENVYMEQPEGFEIKGGKDKIYKLKKAIYGLKQSAKAWYDKLNTVLTQTFDFKKVTTEPCVYFKSHQGKLMIISIYVDDILLFSSCSTQEKNILKEKLMKEFEMRDLGPAHHILGMRITREKGRITLDQSNYIKSILDKFQMSDCKPARTPMEAGLKLHKAEKEETGNYSYRNLIGSLMYVAVCTRPDVAYAVSSLSQFNQSYSEVHWKAAKRVLRYLKGTINHCLVFEKSGLNITAYVDADWAASEVDRKSYTGYGENIQLLSNTNNQQSTDTGRRKRVSRSLPDSRVVITQHFTERTVTPGGDISMQCAASGDRPPQFVWERDGIVVSSNTDARYALGQLMTSDNSVVTQLNITRVRVEDGGLYSCIAKEGDHIAYHENRLDVYGPPYIRTILPVKVQSGESVNLRCPYYGYPISKIDWEHKGETLSSNNLFQRYKRSYHSKRKTRRNAPTVNINGILTIPEVTKEVNSEEYTCIVTSPSGEMARRAFKIEVIEAPVLEDLLLGNNLQEGQIVNIYCNVRSGDLPIHFEWLKDGKRISNNLKVVERSSELFSALVIKKVSLEHCGTYTCVASNHVAKVNRSTELYIKVAPKWLEEPSNSSLLLGRRGTVSCSASGYPQPQVHWMKKDAILGTWQPVLELAGGGILSLPNGTLVIEEVSLADEGLYSCNVENGVGQPLSKTVWMSVNKPVHFEATSTNVTSRLGHPITLECRPLGDEPITVVWTHNGNIVEYRNQRFKLSESKTNLGLTSAISVQYSEAADAGLYQCRANNPYGAATFNVHLTILEPPTPPTELRVESVRARGATVSWRDSLRAHARYYSLQYAPMNYAEVWDHANTVNVTRKESDIRQSIELQNLRPATAYGIKVATGNQVGVSVYTSPVHFTTHEEAPSSAPINVQVDQTENPGELYVSWLPPLKDTHNGLVMGYHIKAVPQNVASVSDDTDTRTLKVSQQSGKQETLLSGLLKNTRYGVSISAFTSAGTGPFSLPVYQDTREGAPEQAPSSVECTAVSSTSLRVGWQPIVLPGQGSSLIGYTVLYATEEGAWQNQTSHHTELYLQGLMKYTNYTVKVTGYSNYGAGPFSYPIVCATLQDVPGPPADIKVLVLSSSSLLISWKRPEHPNGELLFYTVYVKPTSSNGAPQTYRVEPGRTTIEVKELMSRTYEAWVTASTRAGEGSATRRVSQTPAQRVVAGVASLGGTISVGVGSSLLLVCQCVGVPPPRTVWYHKHNIITHHPRFTRNHDDSLLINNIDQSLSGNYTCLAKNLYGSDSVEYTVIVLPLPDAPVLRATPYKDSILVEWEQPYYPVNNRSLSHKISYSLTWKEANGPWQEAWPTNKLPNLSGVQKHSLTALKCGTKYSLRITATNRVGTSQPAYLDVSTLGGVPISPSTNEWLWSNCSHIYVQLAGWDDGGCELRSWEIDYRQLGGRSWIRAHNTMSFSEHPSWDLPALYQAKSYRPSSFVIADLSPGTWYQVRVTAVNEAGTITTTYSYATKNEDGSEVGPPSDTMDLNTLVIMCSSVLLAICVLCSIYIIVRRQSGLTDYRDSITVDNKSESGNLTANTSHTNLANVKENVMNAQTMNAQNRIYSAPIHMRNNSKHELYEISPYAQFAVGFRTFGHVENQDLPSRHNKRYDTETSFQVCSESEDSDSISKSTLKSVPRKICRTPHHR